MKRKVIRKECPKCNKLVGSTAFTRHIKSCSGEKISLEKDEHGRTQKWYDSMHKRKGHGTNQFVKAREKGLSDPIVSEETRKKIGKIFKGKPLSDLHKKKISEKQKENFKSGKLKDIGYCIHFGIPSKNEQIFIEIIDELIIDKNYIKELQFFKYKLDFSWKHRKICIEIDSPLHDETNKKLSDNRKR